MVCQVRKAVAVYCFTCNRIILTRRRVLLHILGIPIITTTQLVLSLLTISRYGALYAWCQQYHCCCCCTRFSAASEWVKDSLHGCHAIRSGQICRPPWRPWRPWCLLPHTYHHGKPNILFPLSTTEWHTQVPSQSWPGGDQRRILW